MSMTLITPPVTDPMTLEEAKRQCRVHPSDTIHDALLQDYLNAAISHFDGPDGILQMALEPQTWRLTLDAFDGNIALPVGPVLEIDSVSYDAGDEDLTTIDADAYTLRQLPDYRAEVVPAGSWPTVVAGVGKVQVEFTAGFLGELDSARWTTAVPASIRLAIGMHVRNQFEPFDDPATYERSLEALLKPFKRQILA